MSIFSKIIDAATEQIVQESIALATRNLIGAQKSHKVLSLLKKTGIVELKDDLGHIYLFSLAEYAVDRSPIELVKVFSNENVQKALKENFPKHEGPLLDAVKKAIDYDFQIRKLKPIYSNLENPLPEVLAFCKIVEEVMKKTDSAVLAIVNEMYKVNFDLLETNERNSFPYQITRHLTKQNKEFHDAYLIGNKYIPLNGEQRLYKEFTRGLDRMPDGEEETKWDSLSHKPLDGFIQNWLADDLSRMLVIMGEYGTGKTTFAQHLAHELAAKYLDPNYEASVTDARKRIPMYFRLLRFEETLDAFITTLCSQTYDISSMNYAQFEEHCEQGEFVVLFDGFDEMTQKMDEDAKERNLGKLRKLLAKPHHSKIILTCREEYFLKEAEKRKLFDAADTTLVHLLPFDEGQVRAFLAAHSSDPDTLWKQLQEIQGLDDLSRRPVLLDLIVRYLPDILARRKDDEPIRITDLYQTCIDKELERKLELKFDIKREDRKRVLKRLATWMFVNDTLVFDVDNIGKEINFREEFQAQTDAEVQNRLSQFLTFSFLIWDGDNRFRLSHKSFRDYLAAIAFAEEVNAAQSEQFSKAKLSQEVMNFMLEMNLDQQHLLNLVLTAKHLPDEQKWQGTNAANLLLGFDKKALAGQNLSECRLEEISFYGCDFTETSLFNTNLKDSAFSKSIFSASSLGKADFTGCTLVIRHWNITSLEQVAMLNGLVRIDCRDNRISDLSPIARLTNLQEFDCNSNQIVNLAPVAGLLNLQRLECRFNKITDLSPVARLANLQLFYCDSNEIADLSPVMRLTNLQTLDCGYNQIINLAPVAGLVNLQNLNCYTNKIVDLTPVMGLVKLKRLLIGNNPINDLAPLHGLKKLKELWISKGQFPQEALKSLAVALPELEIYIGNKFIKFQNLQPLSSETPPGFG